MDKQEYIQKETLKLTKFWGPILLITGAFVAISLSLLDYIVTPENFSKFLVYRLIWASSLLILSFFHWKSNNKYVQLSTILLGTIISSSTVELMILSFGGHQSIYYVGMLIILVFILGFFPFSVGITAILAAVIYFIYLLPILFFDNITNIRVFYNNNIFLIAAVFGGLIWRYFNFKLLIRSLSLEYDLSQEKEQLEKYSTQLEQLVAERTKELKKSEFMLSSLFENATDGIMITDKEGIIVNANQKSCEIHGFDKAALIGTNVRLLIADESKELIKERIDRILHGESLIFETTHYKKDGGKVSLEVSSKAIEIEGTIYIQSFQRDIADKKRLQEQLFQSQKMESIGVLAGGIAHDFNNVLSAILGHAELLDEFGNLDEQSTQRVRVIESSARKAGQMISKLLSFARKGGFENVPISLNNVIKDTNELLERMLMKKKSSLHMELDPYLPSMSGDSNQMEQVIMNLVMNAADAMPEGGEITIRTLTMDLEREAGLIHPLLTPGKYVVLKVSDNGTGIPDEIKDRIFDPFFTTKGQGKGTGLGLAMVYGIVKEHKGVITLNTQVGRGTTFEIYFPASIRQSLREEKPLAYAIGGREKILVIDDEEHILSYLRETLESQGYKVFATDNPVYALDTFKEINSGIDLIITDIIMPLVNGAELIKHFKTIKPDVRIIAISGYEATAIDKRDRNIDAFISKPFQGIYLLSIIRRVLDRKSGTPFSR